MTIIKRETEAMGHIHVCNISAAPCDDPEDQMVVAIGSEGSDFHSSERGLEPPMTGKYRLVGVFYCHLKTYCGPCSETMQSPE